MAETLDKTVTTAEPEGTPPAEETTPKGKEPEGSETAKPESKFLQRLGKLLGIGDEEGDGADGNGPKQEDKDGKAYTEADVQARIDAAKAEWDRERQEQERLSKLSPEERAKAEAAKTGDRIAQLEAQLRARDIRDKAAARLSSDGYPAELASLLPDTSEQDLDAAYDRMTKAFDGAVAAAVKDRLRGKTPAGIGKNHNQTEQMRNQIAAAIRGGMSNG